MAASPGVSGRPEGVDMNQAPVRHDNRPESAPGNANDATANVEMARRRTRETCGVAENDEFQGMWIGHCRAGKSPLNRLRPKVLT